MPKQNTSPADYPQAILQQIEQLAQNIAIARKRRGETQAQWAKKLGVSQPTMARIERGDPAVAMASYVMCMWLINPSVGLADLISPLSDHAALEREVSKASKKRRGAGSTRSQRVAPTIKLGHLGQVALEAHEPQPVGTEDARRMRPFSDPLSGLRNALEGATGKHNAMSEGLAALLMKRKDAAK